MQNVVVRPGAVGDVEERGFAIVHDVFEADELDRLVDILEDAGRREGIVRRGGVLAVRNLLETVPELADLARSARVRALVDTVLGADCFAVRGILFDKTPRTNWKVAWHQDLTIAVRERRDVPGFGPWTEKAGVHSVQPPDHVLAGMLTVRLNLDDCTEDNGPVRVLPGSHAYGRLSSSEIASWRSRVPEVLTVAPRGAVLLMRPLLLHASSPASRPGRRRIVHIDYAAAELSGGLRWMTRL